MGDVSLIMRVMPEDPQVDLERLASDVKAALPGDAKLANTNVAPFAFGLKALMCTIVVPDEAGMADQVEEALRGVPKVQGVELVDMGRLA